jgi:hypothetical protein
MTTNQELLKLATVTILSALKMLAENQQYVANGNQPPKRAEAFEQTMRDFDAAFTKLAGTTNTALQERKEKP